MAVISVPAICLVQLSPKDKYRCYSDTLNVVRCGDTYLWIPMLRKCEQEDQQQVKASLRYVKPCLKSNNPN